MEKAADAEKARQELHGSTVEGRKIEVSISFYSLGNHLVLFPQNRLYFLASVH